MNNEMTREMDDELEIDLQAFIKKVMHDWYYVLIGLLVGVLIASMYSTFMVKPTYSSSSSIYLRGSSKSISLSDLQLGSQLTKDYEIIIKSRPNMERVIETLGLQISADRLAGMINVSNAEDTRILKISITTTDPYLSRDIVNQVVETGMNSIREIDSQEPYVIERAIANGRATNSSVLKMAMLGGIAGAVMVVGLMFLLFIFGDKVSSVEDVEKILGVPVIGVVKENDKLAYAKKMDAPKKNKNNKKKNKVNKKK